jgi:hypothetical protein
MQLGRPDRPTVCAVESRATAAEVQRFPDSWGLRLLDGPLVLVVQPQ